MADDALTAGLIQGTIQALANNPGVAQALGFGLGKGLNEPGPTGPGPSPFATLTQAQVTTLLPAVQKLGKGLGEGLNIPGPVGTRVPTAAEKAETQRNSIQLAKAAGAGFADSPAVSPYVKAAAAGIILASFSVVVFSVYKTVKLYREGHQK